MNENPYAAPQTEAVSQIKNVEGEGSLEAALAGGSPVHFEEVLREAWGTVGGFKWTVWSGFLAFIGVSMLFLLLFATLGTGFDGAPSPFLSLIVLPVILGLGPWIVGVQMLGLRRAKGLSVTGSEVLRHASLHSIFGILLVNILTQTGFLFLYLPGVFLTILFHFVPALIGDRKVPFWTAMMLSVRISMKYILVIFLLYLVAFVTYLGCILTLGIGVIWWFPWMVAVVGIMHRRIVGVQTQS